MRKLELSAREAIEKLDDLVSSCADTGLCLYYTEANGEVYYTEIAEKLHSLDAEVPVTLVFYTEPELISATLVDALDLLNYWKQELPITVQALYGGEGSIETLAQLAEALAWLQEVSTQLAGRGYDMVGWPERLRDAIQELVRTAESNRSTKQADFLLYELQGTLEGLQERLAEIKVVVGDPA